MKKIQGGRFLMGTDDGKGYPTDLEGPQLEIEVADFWIDETAVTNKEFQQFIKETGYQTEAEKFGWSYVFHYFLTEEQLANTEFTPQTPWWRVVEGAYWAAPEGPDSTIEERLDHPVVHISRNDALAYCKWAGKRLPTEAEWEFAARAGSTTTYPWGTEFLLNGKHVANIWQGNFPTTNTLEDGYAGTAPVTAFPPNAFGLYQMIGNVWEWCANPGKIPLTDFQTTSSAEFWQANQEPSSKRYAIRGGSFLCHESYCNRYRVAARNSNTGDSTSNNLGFRCVKDC